MSNRVIIKRNKTNVFFFFQITHFLWEMSCFCIYDLHTAFNWLFYFVLFHYSHYIVLCKTHHKRGSI